MLQRLADKTSTANTASTLIDALTTPLPGGGAEEPAAKHRRLSAARRPSVAHQELVDSLPTPNSTNPTNKLDASGIFLTSVHSSAARAVLSISLRLAMTI